MLIYVCLHAMWHTSAYVNVRQHTSPLHLCPHADICVPARYVAYVSIRQRTSAYVTTTPVSACCYMVSACYVSAYSCTCVRMLLHTYTSRPRTTTYVCPHATTYVCPHATTYVHLASSYYYLRVSACYYIRTPRVVVLLPTCVRMLLHTYTSRPRTTTYVSSDK